MNVELLKREMQYRTARSGGSGGQNVNKVETKVEIIWDINASQVFNDADKALIFNKLENQINKEGLLQVVNQTERSQLGNKQLAEKKMIRLIEKALKKEKERKPTDTPPSVIAARKREKRSTSEKKATRGKVRIQPNDGDSDLSS